VIGIEHFHAAHEADQAAAFAASGCLKQLGHPFGRVFVGGHHQQIDIREAIPVAPDQGAVAEGFSAGVQPDAAIVGPEGVVKALAQRRDPTLPLLAAQWSQGALTGGL
jgi:hypothetical protein